MTQPTRKLQIPQLDPSESDADELIETAVRKRNPYKHLAGPKYRTRRISVDQLNVGVIRASAKHPTLGYLTGTVEDLSLYGLAIVVREGAFTGSLLMSGDKLENLVVQTEKGILYEGSASIRYDTLRGHNLVLGVELESHGLDLRELYRQNSSTSFEGRLRQTVASTSLDQISPAFKAWVADVKVRLEILERFLDEEEKSFEHADRLLREQTFREYLEIAGPTFISSMNEISGELAQHVHNLDDKQHAIYRAFLQTHLLPFVLKSPLLKRSFAKPLGYAGDYESMNMIYRNEAEGDSLFSKLMNLYALQESAGRVIRSRLDYMKAQIRDTLRRYPQRRVRFAALGCGPAREFCEILEEQPDIGSRIDLILMDQEERAIEYCERTLATLAAQTNARVHFVRESVRKLLARDQVTPSLGQRDFIYSVGLFDYLSDRSFVALMDTLMDSLDDGGRLFIGNMGENNSSRWMMEYYLDWFLLYRTPDHLMKLGNSLRIRPQSVSVESEPLGINLFLAVTR